MKKRLLSAALALAMVLTLLPMSVFAADPASSATGDGTETATYVDKANANLGIDGVDIADAPGWFAQVKGTDAEANKVRYVKITSGFVVNGKYYSVFPMNAANTAPLSTTFTSIGSVNADLKDSTSVNADVYSGTLALTGASLTSITVNSTRYTSEGRDQSDRGAVTLPTGWPTDATKGVSLSLTNVTCAGSVSVSAASKGNVARSITLNNATLAGGATLNGTDDGDMTKTAAQSVSLSNNSSIGAVELTGSSSSYAKIANSTATGKIDLTAPGGYVEVSGYSQTGAITVDSGERNDPGKAVAVPQVRVTGTNPTGVTSIARSTDDTSTNASSFTISGGSNISGAISTANGSVTVTSSTTDTIAVDNGSVTVNGPTAETGVITLGKANKGKVSITVTGTGNTIGGITNLSAELTVTLPPEPSNNYGTITDSATQKYTGHNVKGGTFDAAVPASWLANEGAGALKYQLEANSKVTYYNDAQLGLALTAQNLDSTNNTLSFVEPTIGTTQTITFKNGDTVWGALKGDGYTPIILPTEVAGVTVTSWFDGKTSYPAGGSYTSPDKTTATVTLNAQESTTDVKKLLNAAAASADIDKSVYVSLGTNNVINVSGGVASEGRTPITIDLYTDVAPNTPVQVVVVYNSSDKSLTFASGQTLGQGMTLEVSGTSGLDTLRLSNGTKYTLNGSGLKVLAIAKANIDTASKEVVVTARVSGYTDAQNTALATQLMGTVGTDSKFDWSASPLMAQAVNAAAATITESQLKSWTTQAQQAAWRAKNNGTMPTDLSAVGFDTVKLIPYLAVNVTAYNANGTMTATFVPSYRVVVGNPASGDYKDVFKGKTTGDISGNYIVQTGRALTNLAGELGQIDVTLKFPTGSALLTAWAHQDGQYAYEGAAGKFEITHGTTNGLGTMVFNTTAPLVELKHTPKKDDGTADTAVSTYYDSLQAAVDDTKPEWTDTSDDIHMDEITVDLNYKGSTAISVTGVARKFEVVTQGNHNITASASGVIVERSKDGKTFTVQLTKDTAAAGENIVVASATGGSASVSTKKANVGSTVTITLSASAGYTASGVSVKTSSGATVSVSGSGSTYTFTMPSGTVTVTPSFTKTQVVNPTVSVGGASTGTGTASTNTSGQVAPGTTVTVTTSPGVGQRTMGLNVTGTTAIRTGANTFQFSVPSGYTNVVVTPKFDVNNGTLFEDVWSTEYYSNPVRWAVEKGVTNGESTYRFGSGNSCTREQMVTFLYRAAGSPAVGNVNNPFWDVRAGEYYYNAVMWAVSKGITNGVSANQFGVGQPVTRAQAVSFLYRYEGSPAASTNSGFYDVNTREYYAKAVSWANAKGVTNGTSSTMFSPNDYCPREQIVTFLYRDITGNRA